jgi:hypothetical protein
MLFEDLFAAQKYPLKVFFLRIYIQINNNSTFYFMQDKSEDLINNFFLHFFVSIFVAYLLLLIYTSLQILVNL